MAVHPISCSQGGLTHHFYQRLDLSVLGRNSLLIGHMAGRSSSAGVMGLAVKVLQHLLGGS